MNTPTSRATGTYSPPVGVKAGAQLFLVAAIVILVVITAVRARIWWGNRAGISFASGVMISMAADMRAGVLYRPLFGLAGYGGTRYFPLYFCLHALLLKLGMPVLLSAYLLCTAAIVALILGTFRLLRELGAEPWLAACSAVAVLAASSVQLSLATPQADGLAAALNVWGLAVIARRPHNGRRIFLASLLFTLAWSAKLTTVFGLAVALIWLLATGYKRVAGLLAGETFVGYLIVAGTMMVASQGRVVDVFKACASGGADWRFIVSGPLRMLSIAAYTDPGLVLFASLAVLVLALALFSSKPLQNLPALFFIATLAVTVLIFGSPGTAGNHLLDVQVAAVILLGNWVAHAASPSRKELGVYALSLLTLFAAFFVVRHLKSWSGWYRPHEFQRVIDVIGPTNKPILAENPVIPVLAGQRPYVLDPWMVRLLGARTPGFEGPLLERLRRRDFSAVVLSADASLNGVRRWYDTVSFGPGFVPALLENYRLARVIDKDWVYLPKTDIGSEAGTR